MTVKNFALVGAPEETQDRFSYRLGATYVSRSGLAPYVSRSTSFQPQVGQDRSGRAFSPSEGEQIEAGLKYDGRGLPGDVDLLATAAVYYLKQTNLVTLDPIDPLFSVQTGAARVRGAELELVTRVRDTFSLNASYTYADAEVTRSNVPEQVGARLFGQPEHKASLFGDYTLRSGPAAGLGFGAGVRYVSDSPGALPGPFTPVVYATGEATLLDGVARYDFADWRLAINASNLLDERYAGRCTGPVGCFFAQGRQVIATVTRSF